MRLFWSEPARISLLADQGVITTKPESSMRSSRYLPSQVKAR